MFAFDGADEMIAKNAERLDLAVLVFSRIAVIK
jgi:hypothetical protein